MFSWLLRKSAQAQAQPQISLREMGIRNNVFFRLDSGPLRDAELPTDNEDVPKGAPILQHLCYELPFPWCAHAITISVWLASITAQVGRQPHSLYNLYFTAWEDGWLLAITPPDAAPQDELTEIVLVIHRLITAIPNVCDVRWFHDDVLSCGMFHEGDFERGVVHPVDATGSPG